MRRISPTAFRIARRGTSREINRQIALNLIRSREPVSRAELARLMGVRRGAITRLVDELLESNLIFEGAKGESRRGRKPMHLYIETRRRCVMAADVSASKTALLVTDLLGHPLMAVREFPTAAQPQMLVQDLVGRVKTILAEHPEFGDCVGLGVVVSGLVDLAGGQLKFSPTLGWHDVDLLDPLSAALGLPVFIENSCKACVLAQVWAVQTDVLPLEGPVAFVNISDGVGVGIAIDGKLVRGANNLAGEYGHVTMNMNGPVCSCGRLGCWESYVSRRAVVSRYLGRDPSWPASAVPGPVGMVEIMARARAGEPRALETLHETGQLVGRGFATIVNTIDPRRIYLGGELTAVWDLIEGSVREGLRAQAMIPDAATEIRPVGLGEEARLRGAAALVSAPAFAAPAVA